MKATVAERGQVTIPKELRDKLGLRPGTVLDFHAEAGKLVGVKRSNQDAIDRFYGCIDLGKSTDEFIDEIRGPAK
jgi:AbrB family looped-hinge helix DNA binding protein